MGWRLNKWEVGFEGETKGFAKIKGQELLGPALFQHHLSRGHTMQAMPYVSCLKILYIRKRLQTCSTKQTSWMALLARMHLSCRTRWPPCFRLSNPPTYPNSQPFSVLGQLFINSLQHLQVVISVHGSKIRQCLLSQSYQYLSSLTWCEFVLSERGPQLA